MSRAQPFIPLVLTPWMICRWPMKNTMIMGTVAITVGQP